MYERLFGGSTPLVERLRVEGPFATNEEMLARARAILGELSEAEQIAVINAHPRIGERPERVKAESALSFKEQGYDRDPAPLEVSLRLAQLNEAYEQKF